MIGTAEFIDDLATLTKKNQSGFDTGKDQITYINIAQRKLETYLYANYELNQAFSDFAAPITTAFTGSSNASGILSFPGAEGYNHLLSLLWLKTTNNPIKTQRIGVNQIGIINKIPQRRPNLDKDRVLYSTQSTGFQVYPEQALNFKGIYAKHAPAASITYSLTDVDGEPKRTVSAAVDMIWNPSLKNLLLYMVMDEMGIAHRDSILNEYASLGIQQETITTKN